MSEFIKTGVIGHPVSHTKSPLIHSYWIEKYGRDGSYAAIKSAPADLARDVRHLVEEHYRGFNVTLPHKRAVMDLCDEVDEAARAAGAVNMVDIRDGKIYGTNTDTFGFLQNIKTERPNFDFTAGPAVVLGAGGAARAVVRGLLDEGVPDILLLNRTREKAEEMAAAFASPVLRVGNWDERAALLKNAALLVNATSLGMDGHPPLELDLQFLPQTALVNDIVYAPLHTELLQHAQRHGNPVVTGIGMLLHQARPAFKAWFGIMPEIDQKLLQKVLA